MEMENLIKYCIFDLDGTLLDTLGGIMYHLNSTLTAEGLLSINKDECRRFIGNGARLLVSRATNKSGGCGDEQLERILQTYNAAYNSLPLYYTEPYQGITELISELHNREFHLSVVTNKPQNTAEQLIKHFFADKFDYIMGGREGARLKPDPKDSLDVLAKMGGTLGECAFIGDTSVDIDTAKRMGAALAVGVTWGFRDESELIDAGADAVVHNASELREVLMKL